MSKFFIYITNKRSFRLDFLNNQFEKQTGIDMNADGYIGGQGKSFYDILKTIIRFSFVRFRK
jgi:hypothetical protein